MWCGGRKISQEKLIADSDSVNETKYWIHKFDKNFLRHLGHDKTLGAAKKHSSGIKPVSANDKIIIFSTLNIDNKPTICFIAYTMVDKTFESKETLYDTYQSQKKLKLKGMKYFVNPVIARGLYNNLNFIKNKKYPLNYLKIEYREIDQEDFDKILSKTNLTKKYPYNYDEITYNLDTFILNSMQGLYKVIKEIETKNQLEIKTFLKLLRKFLLEQGITKDLDELEDFYSYNAWKLNFKHNRSRDPDRSVILYNRIGKKRIFSYISLE